MARKLFFWFFGSFKNAFLSLLNDPSWHRKVVICWKTFSTFTMCNIKSIQETKLQILAQIVLLRTLDHSKMQHCDFWMIQHVPYLSQIVSTIFYSEYAISSGFNKPTSRKPLFGTLDHSKMLFYDFWMILHDLVVLPKVEKH